MKADNEIISYREMCDREEVQTLQRGMNYRLSGRHSVVLMSLRHNAPYSDRVDSNGLILIYEGHDIPKTANSPDPKTVDQPEYNPSGSLTQNGLFHQAAQAYKQGQKSAEIVQVYQKLFNGVWSDNGKFRLTDSWMEKSGNRKVFKFILELCDKSVGHSKQRMNIEQNRIIPSQVKMEVWKRDKGRCVECGATDNLHFDHIIPYSKGGSSLTANNIQLLCARHNLLKKDKIE
ncbi:HNH endonuclease [candidate division KSB1 bacterium]|nr:MAG: HNH endonuclease [candidate division KSB1 bacterium]